MKNIFKRILKFLYWFSGIMVILGGLTTNVSVSSFGLSPFLSYSLPLWTLINLCYLFLIFYKRKYRWISLLFVIISLWGMNNTYSIIGRSEKSDLRVMSYNVRLFDVYNWLHRKSWDNWEERKDKGAILDSIYATVEESNPDVLAIQEFFNQPFGTYKTKREFKRKQGFKYVNAAYSFKEKGSQYGMATFSKFPIINKNYVRFSEGQNNGILISDIVKGKDTIRVFNVHLQSFKFGKKHYDYLRKIKDDKYEAIDIPKTKDLGFQLYKGFSKRIDQFEILKKELDNSPYRIVMCGDLNEIALSYIYEELNSDYNDTFIEAGSGLGITHTSDYPFMRIDYIFTSKEIYPTSHQVVRRELSDHYPIVVDLKLD